MVGSGVVSVGSRRWQRLWKGARFRIRHARGVSLKDARGLARPGQYLAPVEAITTLIPEEDQESV